MTAKVRKESINRFLKRHKAVRWKNELCHKIIYRGVKCAAIQTKFNFGFASGIKLEISPLKWENKISGYAGYSKCIYFKLN